MAPGYAWAAIGAILPPGRSSSVTPPPMIWAMSPDLPNPIVPHRDGPTPVAPPATSGHAPVSVEGGQAMSLDQARRRLRVRLLQDLVARGLYRIPTEALAERLADVFERDGS